MNYNFYNKNLKEYARELRSQNSTRAEKLLWKSTLSNKKTGIRFLRQRPILNFIVDFFAPEIGLVIEIDGNSHSTKNEYDFYRHTKITSYGFTILRFSEGEVINNLDIVSTQISHCIHCLKVEKKLI